MAFADAPFCHPNWRPNSAGLCFSRLGVHAAPILPQLKDRDLRGGDLDDGTSDGQGFPVGFRGKPLDCNNPTVHGEETQVVDRHLERVTLAD